MRGDGKGEEREEREERRERVGSRSNRSVRLELVWIVIYRSNGPGLQDSGLLTVMGGCDCDDDGCVLKVRLQP